MKTSAYSEPKLFSKSVNTANNISLIVGGLAVTGGLLASAATISVGAAKFIVDKVVWPKRTDRPGWFEISPYELGIAFESVTFQTGNNRELVGIFFPHPETNKVIITAHGHGGQLQEMLAVGTLAWRHGFNVLLFDYRGCGTNRCKGDINTLGHRELEDLQAAINFIRNRFANAGKKASIGLMGGSLGAAVCLVAAARDPEIQAVWADSSFTDRREIIAYHWNKITRLPRNPFMQLADQFFQKRTGQSIGEFSPIEEVSKMKPRPLFFVHCEGDKIIPPTHAQHLYEAAQGPKELWLEPGLEHCATYFFNREKYTGLAVDFFTRYLGNPLFDKPSEKAGLSYNTASKVFYSGALRYPALAFSNTNFATVHFYNQSKEKGIKATGIGIE
jgi:dipeptidyl aminopeptidase/acylaminoacyl peptidase